MQRNFDVVVEKDREGYYVASVPALPGCHTQAGLSMNSTAAYAKQLGCALRWKA